MSTPSSSSTSNGFYIKSRSINNPGSGDINRQKGRAEVKLNVYDMVSMASFNQYSSPIGFGVFHSGAEIYGCEYAYGGHNNYDSGVFEIAPKDVTALGVESFKFRETIVIGYTDFNQDEVKQIVEQLGVKFRGDKYHLLHQNCNHFTDELTKILCGQGIPSWVNRMAHVSSSMPFLERWLSRYMPLAPNDRDFPTELRNRFDDDTPESSPTRRLINHTTTNSSSSERHGSRRF